MEKYITKEKAQSLEVTLRNSRDQKVTLSFWDIIKKEKDCGGGTYFPTELAEIQDPKERDWLEAIEVPVFNVRFNPETQENEFCEPYWGKTNGLYSTDAYLKTMFWHEGKWLNASSYRPEIVRPMDWREFVSPLFK